MKMNVNSEQFFATKTTMLPSKYVPLGDIKRYLLGLTLIHTLYKARVFETNTCNNT